MINEWTRKTKELFALVVNGNNHQETDNNTMFFEESLQLSKEEDSSELITILASNGKIQVEINKNDAYETPEFCQYAITSLDIEQTKQLVFLLAKAIQNVGE